MFFFALTSTSTTLAQDKIPTLPTYWCVKVEDIISPQSPMQGSKFTVGVVLKFTSQVRIVGSPGPSSIKCNCPIKGPYGTVSLRLIGVKYSPTETNLLEYYGPTPAFPPYDYSGFPVIGVIVTEADFKRGKKEVWGWATKEPLQCRDFEIYASLAVYKEGVPRTKENECHPHVDFKKQFKPICLNVPKG